jgi:zinc transport system ATP-binding protein
VLVTAEPIRAEHLSFSYSGAHSGRPVVDDVSLTLARGEFLALVGPNGSGKTTLLKLVLGLLQPSAGSVALFGSDPRDLRERWRVGYVPQRPALAPDLPATVEEIVATGRLSRRHWGRRSKADREAVDHALSVVELSDLRNRRIADLSGGQQQRAFIARALAGDPELLILDEPIAGVDSDAQGLFRDALVHHIRSHDGSVMLVSHELSAVASDIHRVVVIKQSVRFDGPPANLVAEGVSLGVHAEDLPAWLEELG